MAPYGETPAVVLVPYAGAQRPLFTGAGVELPVVFRDCTGKPLAYWRFLDEWWYRPLTLLVVEHDMILEPWHLAELVDCSAGLCSQAYSIHRGPGRLDHYCHANPGNVDGTPAWVRHGEPFATFSGLGCAKLTWPARRHVSIPRATWQDLDHTVSTRLRQTWHLHWPGVEHAHHPRPPLTVEAVAWQEHTLTRS